MRRFLRGPIVDGIGIGVAILLLVMSRMEHIAAGELTESARGGYFSGGVLLLIAGSRRIAAALRSPGSPAEPASQRGD